MQIVKTEADPLFRTDDEKDIEAVQMCQVSGGGGGFALVLRWFYNTHLYSASLFSSLSLSFFLCFFFKGKSRRGEAHVLHAAHRWERKSSLLYE